jgi:hypothetical protein
MATWDTSAVKSYGVVYVPSVVCHLSQHNLGLFHAEKARNPQVVFSLAVLTHAEVQLSSCQVGCGIGDCHFKGGIQVL